MINTLSTVNKQKSTNKSPSIHILSDSKYLSENDVEVSKLYIDRCPHMGFLHNEFLNLSLVCLKC